jgi:hypothetical protein
MRATGSLQKTSGSRLLLQEEVILTRKRDETRASNASGHLPAKVNWRYCIIPHVHHKVGAFTCESSSATSKFETTS